MAQTKPQTSGQLARRLERGWEVCNKATDPAERERLEDFLIGLLREYEQAYDLEQGRGELPS